ncbi:glucuronate isomerase [Jiella pacifica]|uniref:Uronate isomerase n=1 Tax=Jiella pacifica TaxID=2696469 RepID=A0A6N9T688_9HYPH|nr:glucuronate isomerase [Jiella pacifica]NDW05289.1 glucuronate isomerase [Jiella pacifica]
MALLDDDRLFPADAAGRKIARALYDSVKPLPIVSPHGHTEPRWFAENQPFPDPAQLIVVPDHYIFRMLVSQGIGLAELGVPSADGAPVETDGRKIWRRFAEHYHLFRGTPTRLWLDDTFQNLFGLDVRLSADTAYHYYDHIAEMLTLEEFRPRALYERFGVEVIATTESALDDLAHHRAIRDSGWPGRVITTYRPDAVTDPDVAGFAENLKALGDITGCDTGSFAGYLEAHRRRRAFFREHGATATDHGHPTARTANLSGDAAAALYDRIKDGSGTAEERELFRAQMLTEMAKFSVEDGMVMQLHVGSWRSHSDRIFKSFGRDRGFDIPQPTNYVAGLKPLLDVCGLEKDFTLIVFTLDETVQSRELAPLAGVYPCLKLGPPWWFFDAPEGMMRFRQAVTETAGFYNTAGFNDDTRAFCSIPARHDVARRVDSAYLAGLVTTGRLDEDEAFEVAHDLTYRLAKQAYRL